MMTSISTAKTKMSPSAWASVMLMSEKRGKIMLRNLNSFMNMAKSRMP